MDMKKKIVMIRSNPVDPDSRVEKEANSLVKNGYDVQLLVWDRTQNGVYDDIKSLANSEIKRTRLGSKATYGEGFKNLKSFVLFQYRIVKWILNHRHDIDCVHACDFDTAFASAVVCKILGIPYVFDIFDYIGTNPRNFIESIVNVFEHWIINHANGTIICTEQRKEQIKGSHPKRLAVIHNSPERITMGNIKIKSSSNKIKIVYVGILQDFRMILELAEIVKESPQLELHIGGFGKLEEKLQYLDKTTPNIFFYGKLSYPDTLALESQADIMTALYDPSIGNHYYAAPNKFYEALFLGKPLIMVKNTGMSQVVEQNNIGVLIDYDKNALIEGISKIVEKKEDWGGISERMKNIYEKEYSWKKMEEHLISFYSKIWRS
jgi:glycosyltransferase involved in cell wall biosynthesis